MKTNNNIEYSYYSVINEEIFYVLKDWQFSYSNCKLDWDILCKKLCFNLKASSYNIKNFQEIRFKFSSENIPKGWKRHVDRISYILPQEQFNQYFHNMPKPDNFNSLCESIGFPSLKEHNLVYLLLWTSKGKLILSMPSINSMKELGIEYSDTFESMLENHFKKVSKLRMNYWFAKDALLNSGEELD